MNLKDYFKEKKEAQRKAKIDKEYKLLLTPEAEKEPVISWFKNSFDKYSSTLTLNNASNGEYDADTEVFNYKSFCDLKANYPKLVSRIKNVVIKETTFVPAGIFDSLDLESVKFNPERNETFKKLVLIGADAFKNNSKLLFDESYNNNANLPSTIMYAGRNCFTGTSINKINYGTDLETARDKDGNPLKNIDGETLKTRAYASKDDLAFALKQYSALMHSLEQQLHIYEKSNHNAKVIDGLKKRINLMREDFVECNNFLKSEHSKKDCAVYLNKVTNKNNFSVYIYGSKFSQYKLKENNYVYVIGRFAHTSKALGNKQIAPIINACKRIRYINSNIDDNECENFIKNYKARIVRNKKIVLGLEGFEKEFETGNALQYADQLFGKIVDRCFIDMPNDSTFVPTVALLDSARILRLIAKEPDITFKKLQRELCDKEKLSEDVKFACQNADRHIRMLCVNSPKYSVEWNLDIDVPKEAFKDCKTLKSFTANWDGGYHKIGPSAFEGSGLESASVSAPNGTVDIGPGCFYAYDDVETEVDGFGIRVDRIYPLNRIYIAPKTDARVGYGAIPQEYKSVLPDYTMGIKFEGAATKEMFIDRERESEYYSFDRTIY